MEVEKTDLEQNKKEEIESEFVPVNTLAYSDMKVSDTKRSNLTEEKAMMNHTKETEERENGNVSEKFQGVVLEELTSKKSDTTRYEAPLAELEESESFTYFSSDSLPSLSENFSTLSDLNLHPENHVMIHADLEWDAADKEYMGITSEEAAIDYVDTHADMEYMDIHDDTSEIDQLNNRNESIGSIEDISKAKTWKAQREVSNDTCQSFAWNILQSEDEIKIQMQNRIRSLVSSERKTSQERFTSETRESGIFEMGWSSDSENWEQKEEDENTISTKEANPMGQHKDMLSNSKLDTKITENTTESELECQFYSLLNNLIKDLKPESVGNNSITNMNDKTVQTNIDGIIQTLGEEEYHKERGAINEETENENLKFYSLNVAKLEESKSKDDLETLKACYACDASTQTEKIKKAKRCQIM